MVRRLRGSTERGVPAAPQNSKIRLRQFAIVAAWLHRSVPPSFDRSRFPPSCCRALGDAPRRPQPRTEGIRAAPVTQRPRFLERSPSRPLFDLCAPCSFRRGDRHPGHGHSIGLDLRGNPTPSESTAAAVVGSVVRLRGLKRPTCISCQRHEPERPVTVLFCVPCLGTPIPQ